MATAATCSQHSTGSLPFAPSPFRHTPLCSEPLLHVLRGLRRWLTTMIECTLNHDLRMCIARSTLVDKHHRNKHKHVWSIYEDISTVEVHHHGNGVLLPLAFPLGQARTARCHNADLLITEGGKQIATYPEFTERVRLP